MVFYHGDREATKTRKKSLWWLAVLEGQNGETFWRDIHGERSRRPAGHTASAVYKQRENEVMNAYSCSLSSLCSYCSGLKPREEYCLQWERLHPSMNTIQTVHYEHTHNVGRQCLSVMFCNVKTLLELEFEPRASCNALLPLFFYPKRTNDS